MNTQTTEWEEASRALKQNVAVMPSGQAHDSADYRRTNLGTVAT
ncbi:hypothetical protein [Pseudomonas kulmbachensis]|nr:hypothetical protein [Pseudomonas sp. V3/3/4/13]